MVNVSPLKIMEKPVTPGNPHFHKAVGVDSGEIGRQQSTGVVAVRSRAPAALGEGAEVTQAAAAGGRTTDIKAGGFPQMNAHAAGELEDLEDGGAG